MAPITLHYLFDPLCGWCYASAPALAQIADVFSDSLHLCPTGLFSGEGARPLDAHLAVHARSNDQRIAAMTGQPFSAAYFTQILGGAALRFDSMPMVRVLTLVRDLDPALEPGLFRHLQTARYVNGLDTSSVSVVAQLGADWLERAGHTLASTVLVQRLVQDQSLARLATERIQQARSLLASVGATGVPLLVAETQGSWHPIGGSRLYGSPEALIDELQTLRDVAA